MTARNRFFTQFAAEVCGFDKNLNAGKCAVCGRDNPEATIRDAASAREFELTQMCQNCQDRIFAEPKDADAG